MLFADNVGRERFRSRGERIDGGIDAKLRHRAFERDAETRARRLVHLAVNKRDFGFAQIFLIDYARLAHLRVEIVAFTGALADARENGEPAVAFRDVVDQLENDDGLANARAAECADFAAFREGA